jgi:hypothetical protein
MVLLTVHIKVGRGKKIIYIQYYQSQDKGDVLFPQSSLSKWARQAEKQDQPLTLEGGANQLAPQITQSSKRK